MSDLDDRRDWDAPDPDAPSEAVLARRCLRAWRYGVRNFRSLLAMTALTLGLALLVTVVLVLPTALGASALMWSGLLLAAVLVGSAYLVAGGYFLSFWLDAFASGLSGYDDPPYRPAFQFNELLTLGLRGLGLYVVYVLPVFTLPLLPLGILALAFAEDGRAYDLTWAVRAAARRPLQLGVLWAVLALWTLAMFVGLWGTLGAYLFLASGRGILANGVVAFLALLPVLAVASAIACVFATVIFRCVGEFARLNPVLIDMLPERAPPGRTAIFVLGGLLVSILMQVTGWTMIGTILR